MTDTDVFWHWFAEQEAYIHQELEQHPDAIAEAIATKLKTIHPDLVFDIPFELENGKRQLILSADGDASLFDLVFSLVDAAPDLPNWNIVALRPRTNQADQAIDLAGLYLEYEDIFFRITNDDLPLELEIYIRGYDNEDNRYVHGFFLLLDTLLGEYDAVTYTETVAIHPYDDEIEDLSRFITLRDIFDERKQKKN